MISFIIICLTVCKFHHKHCPEIQTEFSGCCILCNCSQYCFCSPSPQTHILTGVRRLFYLTVSSFICPMPSVFITLSKRSYACQNSQHMSGMAKQFKFFYPSAVCRSYNCHLSLKTKYSQYAVRFDA